MGTKWRAALGTAGAAALLTAVVVGTAGPAGAESSPGRSHVCADGFFGTLDDDGPLSDYVHHNVEPLLEPLLPDAHQVNCLTVKAAELAVEQLGDPSYLPGVIEGVSCLLPGLLPTSC